MRKIILEVTYLKCDLRKDLMTSKLIQKSLLLQYRRRGYQMKDNGLKIFKFHEQIVLEPFVSIITSEITYNPRNNLKTQHLQCT